MNFENGVVAMRKGYKIQRKSQANRLNAVCLYIDNGKLMSEQTHELSLHKKEPVLSFSANNLMASDWSVV